MTLAFAARGQVAILDVHGDAQAAARVLVKAPDGSTASLYTDRTKGTAASNPATTDGFGQLVFFSDQLGVYTLLVTTAAGTFTRLVEAQVDAADDAYASDVSGALATAEAHADSGDAAHAAAAPAHAASKVSVAPIGGLAATDVQAAIAEIFGTVGSVALPEFVIEDYVQGGDVNDSEAFNRVAVAVNIAGRGHIKSRGVRQLVVQKQTLTGQTGQAGSWVPAPLLALSHTTGPVLIEGLDILCAAGLRVGQFDPVTGIAKGIVDYAVASGGSNTQDTASLADVISTDRCGLVVVDNVKINGNMVSLVKGGGVGVVGDSAYEVNGTGISLKGATIAVLRNVDVTGMVSDNIEINDPDVTETSDPHPVILDNVHSTYSGRHTMWFGGTNSATVRNSKFLYAGRGVVGASYAAACDIEGYSPKCVMNIHFEDTEFSYARGQLASAGGGTINAKNVTYERTRFIATGSKPAVNAGCPGARYIDCEIFGQVASMWGDSDPRRATQIVGGTITDRPLTPALNVLDNAGAVTLTAQQRDPTAGTVSIATSTDGLNRWQCQVYLDTGSGPVLRNSYGPMNTVNSVVATTLAADPDVFFADGGSPNVNPVSQPAPLARTNLPVVPVTITPSSQTAVAVNVLDQFGVPTVSAKQKNFTRTVAFAIAAGTTGGTWKLLVYVDAVVAPVETFDNLTTVAAAVTATAGGRWVTLTDLASGSSGANAYPVVTAKTTLTSTVSYATAALLPAVLPENALLERVTLDAYTIRPFNLTGQNNPGEGPGILDRVTAVFRQTTVDGAPLADKAVVSLIRAPVDVRGHLNIKEAFPASYVPPAHGFYIDAPINFQCYLYDTVGKITMHFTPKPGIEGALLAVSVAAGSVSGFKIVLYYFGTRNAAETYDNLARPSDAVAAMASSNLVIPGDDLSGTTPPGNNPAVATLQRFPGLRIAAGSHVNVPGPVIAWGTWDPTLLGTYAQGRIGPSEPPPLARVPLNAVGPTGLVQRRPDPARQRAPGITVGPVLPTGYHEQDDVHIFTLTSSSNIMYVAGQSGWSPSDWVARSVATPAVVVGQGALVVANRWIGSPHSSRTTLALTNQRMTLTPLWLTKTVHVTTMRVEVTALATGASINLGVYADSFNLPAAKLGQATGSVDASVATGSLGAKDLAINLTLAPGLVWLAVAALGAPSVRAVSAAGYTLATISGPEGTGIPVLGVDNTGVTTSTLPDPAAASSVTGSAPLVWLFTDTVS